MIYYGINLVQRTICRCLLSVSRGLDNTSSAFVSDIYIRAYVTFLAKTSLYFVLLQKQKYPNSQGDANTGVGNCEYIYISILCIRGRLQRTSAKISDFQTTRCVRIPKTTTSSDVRVQIFPTIMFTHYFFQLLFLHIFSGNIKLTFNAQFQFFEV